MLELTDLIATLKLNCIHFFHTVFSNRTNSLDGIERILKKCNVLGPKLKSKIHYIAWKAQKLSCDVQFIIFYVECASLRRKQTQPEQNPYTNKEVMGDREGMPIFNFFPIFVFLPVSWRITYLS